MRQTRAIPLTLLGILALWQTATLVHLITTVHTVCPHGKVVEVTARGHHHNHLHDSKHHNEDNCRFLDQLTEARAVPNGSISPVVWIQAADINIFIENTHAAWHRYLYRLSPSQSPPIG